MSIAVRDLVHVYHPGTPLETKALDGVTFEAAKGIWVAVVGHTGSGKSTLAQHLNGLLLPSGGSVSIDGVTIRSGEDSLRVVRQKVGLVFQYPEQQLFEETVFQEVAFGPKNWGFPPDEIKYEVEKSLSQVGIGPEFFGVNPFRLSGGQKRRVAIASVLSSRPDYLVLDEPTAGLDSAGKRQLLALLLDLKALGKGIVHVTHDMDLALGLADIVLVLDEGKSLLWGPPELILGELLEHDIRGLVIPPMVRFAGKLRDLGFEVPLTWDPVRLADAICRSRRP
ncbi:MAG: ATP-binding cassette domain-containing protein [Thermovirgaceae bacterium]|nr:ATP-binding cassette domain-containing protein [Thermovirgaceae bacterium]